MKQDNLELRPSAVGLQSDLQVWNKAAAVEGNGGPVHLGALLLGLF